MVKKQDVPFFLMLCSFAELFNSRGNENYDVKHVVVLCKRIHSCSELVFSNPAWLTVEVIKDVHIFTHL